MTRDERDAQMPGSETPEADALEQEAAVTDDDPELTPSDDPEAPEADALEQAQAVPLDDDEEPR